jgi:hypothetical protein
MTDKILKAIYGSPDKPLVIGDIAIPCYVLEDGRRVLSQRGIITTLNMSKGTIDKNKRVDRMVAFLTGKALEPFVSSAVIEAANNPIIFKLPNNGSQAFGYEATILVDICDSVLRARQANQLVRQQVHIAERCEILVRGFARVGIIALIDEVTGYQEVRARNALNEILEAYISKELLPWTKRFPDEFYKELFRLRDWQYNPFSVKRPILVGKLTNQIVYKKLPPGVLEELRERNPVESNGKRKYHHHRFLTSEIGNPHLEKHLVAVISLMRASTKWKNFIKLLERAFPSPIGPNPHLPGLEEFIDEMDEIDDD